MIKNVRDMSLKEYNEFNINLTKINEICKRLNITLSGNYNNFNSIYIYNNIISKLCEKIEVYNIDVFEMYYEYEYNLLIKFMNREEIEEIIMKNILN